VALPGWLSFALPTSPSLGARQLVSAPRRLNLFRFSDESLALLDSWRVLAHWLTFFCCPDEILALRSTGGKCPSLAVFRLLF
jgi:hypothetical protein